MSLILEKFNTLFESPVEEGGFGYDLSSRDRRIPIHLNSPAGEFDNLSSRKLLLKLTRTEIAHGSVLIAITSCTNTSNPSVMLAAGLVAKEQMRQDCRSLLTSRLP